MGGALPRHVLPMFEKVYPTDERPRRAIEVCRKWARTGVFKMAEIRGASLSAMGPRRLNVMPRRALRPGRRGMRWRRPMCRSMR